MPSLPWVLFHSSGSPPGRYAPSRRKVRKVDMGPTRSRHCPDTFGSLSGTLGSPSDRLPSLSIRFRSLVDRLTSPSVTLWRISFRLRSLLNILRTASDALDSLWETLRSASDTLGSVPERLLQEATCSLCEFFGGRKSNSAPFSPAFSSVGSLPLLRFTARSLRSLKTQSTQRRHWADSESPLSGRLFRSSRLGVLSEAGGSIF